MMQKLVHNVEAELVNRFLAPKSMNYLLLVILKNKKNNDNQICKNIS